METAFKFENIIYIHLIWVLIAVFIVVIVLLLNKKVLIQKFTSKKNFKILASLFSLSKQVVKHIIVFVALLLIILALMRPLGSPEDELITVKGRDIVFILDVSKSMLAVDEDSTNSRLDKAKLAIRDLVNSLHGDRVGLVVFAGASVLKSPLTNDYNFFKTVLRRVSPYDVKKGGSLIGDAIRYVDKYLLSNLKEDEIRYKEIILITDGEDQESFPVKAAESVVEKGIRIHTVGIGSLQGSMIPIRDDKGNITGYIKDDKDGGDIHRSVLNEEPLKEIALITGGSYIPARTNMFYLDELYTKYISKTEKRENEVKTATRWLEMYQFFLFPAIILLFVAFIIPTRRSVDKDDS